MADKLERSAAAGSASSRTTLSNLEGRIVDIQAQLRAVRQQLKDSQQQQHQQQQQQQLQSIQSTDTSGDPSVKEFHGVVSGTSSVLSPSASVSASSAVPAVVDTSHQQYAPHTAYSQRGSYTGGGSRSGYYSNGGRGEYYVSRGRGRGRGGDGESWYSSLSGTADDDGGISGAYSTRGRGRGRGGRGGRGRGAVPMSWSRENEEEKQREDTSNLTDEQSHEEWCWGTIGKFTIFRRLTFVLYPLQKFYPSWMYLLCDTASVVQNRYYREAVYRIMQNCERRSRTALLCQ